MADIKTAPEWTSLAPLQQVAAVAAFLGSAKLEPNLEFAGSGSWESAELQALVKAQASNPFWLSILSLAQRKGEDSEGPFDRFLQYLKDIAAGKVKKPWGDPVAKPEEGVSMPGSKGPAEPTVKTETKSLTAPATSSSSLTPLLLLAIAAVTIYHFMRKRGSNG